MKPEIIIQGVVISHPDRHLSINLGVFARRGDDGMGGQVTSITPLGVWVNVVRSGWANTSAFLAFEDITEVKI